MCECWCWFVVVVVLVVIDVVFGIVCWIELVGYVGVG